MNKKAIGNKSGVMRVLGGEGIKAYMLPVVMIMFGIGGVAMLRSSSALSCSGANITVEARPETNARIHVYLSTTGDAGSRTTPVCLTSTADYTLVYESAGNENYEFSSWYFNKTGLSNTSTRITFAANYAANSTITLNLRSKNTYPTPAYSYPTPAYQTPPTSYVTPNTYPTPKTIQGPSTQVTTLPEDKEPPSRPENFTGSMDAQSGVVRLVWAASTDNTGVTRYVLERSKDGQNWLTVDENIKETGYSDTTTEFNATYRYRVKAVNAKNNVSEHAETEVRTDTFQANITRENGGEISFEDGTVMAYIPAEAVSENTQCSIDNSGEVVDAGDTFTVLDGPYQIICKTANGSRLDTFLKPVGVAMKASEAAYEQRNNLSALVLNGVKWNRKDVRVNDAIMFDVQDGMHFALAAERQTTPLFVKILLVLVVLAGLGGGIVWAMLIRYRRRQRASYNDYIKKHYGL